MGALSFLTTVFAPSDRQVNANPARCLRNRMRGNRCNLCLNICPTDALKYADGLLHFSGEACSNCMGCIAVCPVDALVPHFDLQQFVNEARNASHATLIISCEKNRLFRDNEILFPCLGVFSCELLVYSASTLSQKRLYFNIQGCTGCRNEKVSLWFQENLKSVLRYASDSNIPQMELVTQESGEQAQDDRRSFFKALHRDAVNTAASLHTPAKDQKQTPTSRTISAKTNLLKKALQSNDAPLSLAARMVPRMYIDDNCQPCPRCAGICPTGALKLMRLEQGKQLEFDGSACCGCGLCIEFCKEKALVLSCPL